MLNTEVGTHVMALFALTHPVIQRRALLLHHLVPAAERGAVQALGQVVVELCEMVDGARRADGWLVRCAGSPHVEAGGTSVAKQHLTAHEVCVLEGE